jgi:hypothetical protein
MRPVLALVLCLAACDSPAPAMMGATRHEVEHDGRTYVVYHLDNRVEVIRMGYAGFGAQRAVLAGYPEVVEAATGCRLIPSSVRGDSGEMRGRVSCRG